MSLLLSYDAAMMKTTLSSSLGGDDTGLEARLKGGFVARFLESLGVITDEFTIFSLSFDPIFLVTHMFGLTALTICQMRCVGGKSVKRRKEDLSWQIYE
jgi:hypothetical protein